MQGELGAHIHDVGPTCLGFSIDGLMLPTWLGSSSGGPWVFGQADLRMLGARALIMRRDLESVEHRSIEVPSGMQHSSGGSSAESAETHLERYTDGLHAGRSA